MYIAFMLPVWDQNTVSVLAAIRPAFSRKQAPSGNDDTCNITPVFKAAAAHVVSTDLQNLQLWLV